MGLSIVVYKIFEWHYMFNWNLTSFSIYDSEVFNWGYVVYRCDRSYNNSVYSLGGGVLIAFKSHLSSEILFVPDSNVIEIVFIKIKMLNFNVFVCCLYIPSGSSDDIYNSYSNVLKQFFKNFEIGSLDKVFIVGDFNLSSVDWVIDDTNVNVLLPTNITSLSAHYLHLSLLGQDLSQVNSVVNYQN